MLGLTLTPKSPNAMAIFSVVRRDHFSPVMGSPAVSYSIRNWISVTMSAVFFRLACGRRRNGAFGQNGIATVSQLDRFQPGEQAALLLVEQAVEKQDGRFQFIGRYLKSGGIGQ